MSDSDKFTCSNCGIDKPLNSFEEYNNGKSTGFRRICKSCMNRRKYEKKMQKKYQWESETHKNIYTVTNYIAECRDDPDMLITLGNRISMYGEWRKTEKLANKNNSIVIPKSEDDLLMEKNQQGDINTKMKDTCTYYQKLVHSRWLSDDIHVPLEDIRIVPSSKSYLVVLTTKELSRYEWSVIN
jgi:hypothetical protein